MKKNYNEGLKFYDWAGKEVVLKDLDAYDENTSRVYYMVVENEEAQVEGRHFFNVHYFGDTKDYIGIQLPALVDFNNKIVLANYGATIADYIRKQADLKNEMVESLVQFGKEHQKIIEIPKDDYIALLEKVVQAATKGCASSEWTNCNKCPLHDECFKAQTIIWQRNGEQ